MAANKLHLTDIIALAKSGWKPDDVNNVLDRFEKMNEGSDDSADDEGTDDSADDEGSDDSADDEGSDDSADDEGTDDSTDEKDARIADLEKKLAEAQKKNRSQNNDTKKKKTLDEEVDSIFNDFFN